MFDQCNGSFYWWKCGFCNVKITIITRKSRVSDLEQIRGNGADIGIGYGDAVRNRVDGGMEAHDEQPGK